MCCVILHAKYLYENLSVPLFIQGSLLNLLCLCVLRRTGELKLSADYLFLLRLQSTFDLLYLLTSTPVTAIPYVFPAFRSYYEPLILPYVFPFVQVSVCGQLLATSYNQQDACNKLHTLSDRRVCPHCTFRNMIRGRY